MRPVPLSALLVVPMMLACATPPSDANDEAVPPSDPPLAAIQMHFGHYQGIDVIGHGQAPAVDTDQVPHYELYAGSTLIAEAATDAVVDAGTATLAWVDAAGTLWLTALDNAAEDRRAVAERVLPALVASHGRLAFAERVDGPETAPFVLDLRSLRRTALDDAPGPDEVLGFSPTGDEVLVLSGRTGLASLFVLGVDTATALQLTNVGLRPGPSLDSSKVVAAPASHREVAWGRRGIAFRGGDTVLRIERSGAVEILAPETQIEEVVR